MSKKYKLREGSDRREKVGGKQLTETIAVELSSAEAKELGDCIVEAKKDDGIKEGKKLTEVEKGEVERRKELSRKHSEEQESEKAANEKEKEKAMKAAKPKE